MMFPSPKTVRYKWRWAVAALAAVLVAAAAGIAWAEYHRRASVHALERRAYPEARDHLICYLRIWPRSAAAHVGLARCAGGLGADDEARRFLARARELGESWEGVALEEFLLDAQRGTLSPEGVHLLWDRVERGDPETPRILEALVLGHLSTYQLSVAAIFAERWVEQSPRDAQAVYLRGLVRQGLGDVARAGEDFRAVLALDPEHDAARQCLAEYLLAAGDIGRAAKLFEELLARKPETPALLLGLARCRRLQARTDEAQQLLEPLLAGKGPLVAVLVERARLARTRNDMTEVEKWYRLALDRDPSDHDACRGLVQCLHTLGRTDEAETYRSRADEIDRDLERLHQLHGLIEKAPADPALPYEAGLICLRHGHKAEARRWFQNVLQRDPHHPGARRGQEQALAP